MLAMWQCLMPILPATVCTVCCCLYPCPLSCCLCCCAILSSLQLMSLSLLLLLLVSAIVIILCSSMLRPLHWLCPAISHWQSPTLFPCAALLWQSPVDCCLSLVACCLFFVTCSFLSFVVCCLSFIICHSSFVICCSSFILCCLPCQVIACCYAEEWIIIYLPIIIIVPGTRYSDPTDLSTVVSYSLQPGYQIFLVELWIEGTFFVCSPRTALQKSATTWLTLVHCLIGIFLIYT